MGMKDSMAGDGFGVDVQNIWDNANEWGDPLPAGVYQCYALRTENCTSQQNTPGVRLVLEVADGDHAGETVSDVMWLTTKAAGRAKKLLRPVGVVSPDQFGKPFPKRVTVDVKLVLRKNDDGDEHNEIRSITYVSVDDWPADPLAPAGDDATSNDNNHADDSQESV